MDDLEYIVTGALMHCNKGMGVMPLSVTSNTRTHIQKQLVATERDKTFVVNIPTFGMCATTQKPCIPIPTQWTGTYANVKVNGAHPLIAGSCLGCAIDSSSKIEFITSGQLDINDPRLPKEAHDALAKTYEEASKANQAANEAIDEYDLERNSVGESGFWEGFIPVWGSGRDFIHCVQTHHWWKAAGNLGLVVVDAFTLGADELVIGTVKGGVKGLAEAGGKMAANKIAAIMAAKETAILLAKQAGKKIAAFSLEKLGICIAKACFAKGTLIYTANGAKVIETLQSGDEVWAYNEETGETALKPILNVFEHETDTIVELTIDGEIINTTPEHPFYANGKWIEAGLLQGGDTIQLFNGKAAIVEAINYKFDEELQDGEGCEPTIVYNLEVADWHTYFVGLLCLLVHNQVCLAQMTLEAQKWFQNVRRGYFFNLVWNSELRKQALDKGFQYSQEVKVILKNGADGAIDGLIRLKNGTYKIIERKASDLTKITDETIKSYIRDAAHYGGSTAKGADEAFEKSTQIILHVEKVGQLSKDVTEYAEKYGVTIVDDLSKIIN